MEHKSDMLFKEYTKTWPSYPSLISLLLLSQEDVLLVTSLSLHSDTGLAQKLSVTILVGFLRPQAIARVITDQETDDFSNWKGMYLCVKRLPGFTNSSTCPSGSMKYAPGICTTGTDCPITTLELSTSANTADGWTSVAFGDGRFFNYRQDINSQPIATFRVTIAGNGAKTCLSLLEYPIQNDYLFIIHKGNDCAEYGTLPGSSLLDTDSSAEAEFGYHPWGSDILALPSFASSLAGESAFLTVSPRLQLNSNCYGIDMPGVYLASTSVQNTGSTTLVFSVVAIIMTGLLFVISTLFMCCCRSEDVPWIARLVKSLGICLTIFLTVLGIVLIPAAALTTKYDREISAYKDQLTLIHNNNCFVEQSVGQILTDFSNAIMTASQVKNLWVVFTIIQCVTVSMIGLLLYLAKKK